MIVVDASAMVELLLDTELGRRIDDRIMAADARHAPHLIDAEVAQVLRRFVMSRQITAARGSEALEDLMLMPLRRHAHTSLLDRVFELRSALTAYDSIYLSLAEALGATLITCDRALAKAPDRQTAVELVV